MENKKLPIILMRLIHEKGVKIARTIWSDDSYIYMQWPDEHSKMTEPYLVAVNARGEHMPVAFENDDLIAEDWYIVKEEAPVELNIPEENQTPKGILEHLQKLSPESNITMRKVEEEEDDMCTCGHYTKDHSYEPSDLSDRLDCDKCSCINYNTVVDNPIIGVAVDDIQKGELANYDCCTGQLSKANVNDVECDSTMAFEITEEGKKLLRKMGVYFGEKKLEYDGCSQSSNCQCPICMFDRDNSSHVIDMMCTEDALLDIKKQSYFAENTELDEISKLEFFSLLNAEGIVKFCQLPDDTYFAKVK